MTTEQWKKIEAIVDEVLTHPEEEHAKILREKCCGDPNLLQHVASFLDSITHADRFFSSSHSIIDKIEIEAIPANPAFDNYEAFIGMKVGAYTLTGLLGVGGMGAVFTGKRTDGQFKHTAAIKIIQSGLNRPDIYDHFLRERQILAGLNHENIAQLYDGGVTENNIPYLVMEHVDGTPIDVYCDSHQLNVFDRIQLFRSVCYAVRYAHRNLVIHRDLKPDNILIKQNSTVKVMDFGIAKLLDNSNSEHASTENRSCYLSYFNASPEQIKNLPATTASDIYSLGILLFNLLAGVHPLPLKNSASNEVRELILDHTPVSLAKKFDQAPPEKRAEIIGNRSIKRSIHSDFLNKDLNAIVLKCLSKSADDRYQTVDDLVDDLNRYETQAPVNARNAGTFYKTGKFVLRNKKPLIVAASFLLIAIVSGIFYTYSIQQERDIAQMEANKSTQVTQFVLDLFNGNIPSQSGGRDISARELLNQGIEKTEYLSNQPEIQATMMEVLGRILTQLGEYDDASKLLQKSIDLRVELFGEESLETIKSYEQMGILLSSKGDLFKAQNMLENSLDISKKLPGISKLAMSDAYSELAYVYRRLGKFEEAEQVYRSLLASHEKEFGPDDPRTLSSLSSLGVTLHTSGKVDEAETIYRKVLAKRLNLYDSIHPDIAMSYNNLGSLLLNLGRFDESEELLSKSLEMRRSLFGKAHPKVALTMNNLGILNRNTGKFEEAIDLMNQSLAINYKIYGKEELQTAINLFSLAELYLMTGKYDEAFSHYQRSHQIFREKLPDKSSFIARSLLGMGESRLYDREADPELRTRQIRDGFTRVKQIHPKKTIEFGLASAAMGKMFIVNNQYDKGIEYLQEAITIISEIEGENSIRTSAIESLIAESHSHLISPSKK